MAVALYLIGLWFTQERFIAKTTLDRYFILFIAVATVLLGLFPHSVLSIGILIILTVAYRHYRPIK